MSGPAQVIILGEDNAHVGSLYRAVVDHLNVPSARVRKRPVVGRHGDAKQFVLHQVSNEVKLLRRGPKSAVLIIAMDGDGPSPDQRVAEVSEALADADVDQLHSSERVAIIVPCRNTETWLEFARCAEVDEDTDYKHRRRAKWTGDDFAIVGRALAQSPPPKENPPPALARASAMLRQIFPCLPQLVNLPCKRDEQVPSCSGESDWARRRPSPSDRPRGLRS
jgi:hypothetical protein